MINTNFPDSRMKRCVMDLYKKGRIYDQFIDKFFKVVNRIHDTSLLPLITKLDYEEVFNMTKKIKQDSINFDVEINEIQICLEEFENLRLSFHTTLRSKPN